MLTIPLLASLAFAAVPPAAVDPSTLEQGFTLRSYEIVRALDRVARVAEDATPNVDRLA